MRKQKDTSREYGQVGGGSGFSGRLLLPSHLGIQGAKAVMAVGLERARAKLFGQVEGALIVCLGLYDLRGIAVRCNIVEQPQAGSCYSNAARRGKLFHACGQLRRLSHRRIVDVQVIADGAHYHLTAVEPHAHLH